LDNRHADRLSLFRAFQALCNPIQSDVLQNNSGVGFTIMKRRQFIKASALLITASVAPNSLPAADDESSRLKQAILDYYNVYYSDRDKNKYRALLSRDYLLLENGEIFDAEKDISLMPTPDSDYQRKDSFDFRTVSSRENDAYAVYFLKSDIKDKKDGSRTRQWLESVILRREQGQWRIALLHSTSIAKA
jgi:hypothetical protein